MPDGDQDELRAVGEWWLPRAPDHKVPGILRFTQVGGGELELIGSLHDDRANVRKTETGAYEISSFGPTGSYGRIHGYANRQYMTLEDCFSTGRSGSIFGQTGPGNMRETVHVNYLVEGAHFEDTEGLSAVALSFRLLHFVQWAAPTAIAEQQYWPDRVPDGEPRVKLELHSTPPATVDLHNGLRLEITEQPLVTGDRLASRTLERDFLLQLESEELRPATELLETAGSIQDLVSLGTVRTATFEAVHLFHPDCVQDGPGERTYRLPLAFHGQWSNRESRDPTAPDRHKFWFTLAVLGGPPFLRRWCEVADQHRSTLRRVVATRESRPMFPADRLLNRVAALEAFDREVTGTTQSKLRTRLKRRLAFAGPDFAALIGDDAGAWVDSVVAARDSVAHALERHTREQGASDHFIAEILFALYAVNILRVASAPEEVLRAIASSSSLVFAAARVREGMPAT